MQLKTRKERRFNETEAILPSTLKKASLPSQLVNAVELLSFLGSRNPLPRPVVPGDEVWILDNVAFKGPRGSGWQTEFVMAVFEKEPKCHLMDAVGILAGIIGLADEAHERKTIEERLLPFVWDLRPGRKLTAVHGSKRVTLGPTGTDGVSSDVISLPSSEPGTISKTVASVPDGVTGILQSWTYFSEPEGWSIISDVDDTIKVTNTGDPIAILRETFVNEPMPIPGMPELYGSIKAMLPRDTPWFYLSASPYNLYPFLREFRNKYYPPGAMILREISWRTIAGLLSALTQGTERYKADRLRKIHSWFPRRKMILIGDSTQADPEAYGELYRLYPGWVRCILIRKAVEPDAVGIQEKNEPARFETAFKGIPKDVWHVFEDPQECHRVVRDVINKGL